ncbi:MAG: hypothetical protein L6Q98_17905 [Anaerolineae bacterium]|nr:hypothetical protein [Anaerolineae bacterium]NUQ06187.1 hypothetical protein [Anaerolineae bacterium]
MDIEQIVQMLIPTVKEVIGGMLMMSDSGVIGGMREAGAIAKYLKSGAQELGGNPIIGGLVEGLLGEGGSLELPDITAIDVTTLFNKVGSAANALSGVEGGDQVKQFIYGLAEQIAGAAGGGLFGGGQKFSAGEQQYLEGLRAMLGV